MDCKLIGGQMISHLDTHRVLNGYYMYNYISVLVKDINFH